MKCNDCGESDYEPGFGRADICPTCLDLRGKLFPAMKLGTITLPVFQALQKTLANSHGSGRGARAMREALGLTQPQI